MNTYLRMKRFYGVLAVVACASLAGCSSLSGMGEVLPDNRDQYKESQTLPPLEVPPDLIAAEKSNSMSIPGEEGEGVSMSRYQGQARSGQQEQAPARPTAGNDSGPSSPDHWVSVSGSKSDIWPRLVSFFQDRGHTLRLNDMETGVLTTEWSEPSGGSGNTDGIRDRYKIFSEPGAEPDVTVLFISNERQQRRTEGDGQEWVDQGSDSSAEAILAGELNLYFNGSSAAGNSTSSTSPE